MPLLARRRPPPPPPMPTAPQWAYQATPPVTPTPPSQAGIGGAAGWAGIGIPSHPQQIGLFNGRLLNQFPAYLPGVQLFCGREGGNPNWYYPAVQPNLPLGSIQQTQSPVNVPGAQRYGSIFSGPLGPISARKMQLRVLSAQVRQSGLGLMQWAQGLTPGAPPIDTTGLGG